MIRSRSSRLKTALATVAILAFGAALTATPAAADGPSFNFGINMHGGDMGMGPRPGYDHPRPHFRPMCLTDGQIVGGLEDAGWRRVRIGNDLGHFSVMAYANWHRDRTLYRMVVDRCSGNVDRVMPVRPDRPYYGDQPGPRFYDRHGPRDGYMQGPHSGMSFGFSFGN